MDQIEKKIQKKFSRSSDSNSDIFRAESDMFSTLTQSAKRFLFKLVVLEIIRNNFEH